MERGGSRKAIAELPKGESLVGSAFSFREAEKGLKGCKKKLWRLVGGGN